VCIVCACVMCEGVLIESTSVISLPMIAICDITLLDAVGQGCKEGSQVKVSGPGGLVRTCRNEADLSLLHTFTPTDMQTHTCKHTHKHTDRHSCTHHSYTTYLHHRH